MGGQKVEKVFNHEKKDYEEFCRKNERLRQASTNAMAYSGLMVPVVVSISYLNYAVSACVGGLFALAGLMDIGSLASYLVYVRQSAMPINQCTQQVNFILAALSVRSASFEMMDEEPEVDEGTVTLCGWRKSRMELWANAMAGRADCGRGKSRMRREEKYSVPLTGDVRFEHVVFGYVASPPHPGSAGSNEKKKILDDISLLQPGTEDRICGITGAGKTTIINLINRF